MKTLLFLHREELTDMYIGIAQRIDKFFNIIHVAYSMKEEVKLRKSGIVDIINFNVSIDEMFEDEKIDQKLLLDIDNFFIKNTDGRFTLNGSIGSDRGFSILTYDQALLMSQIYYKFWKNIFENKHIDYVMHEIPSLLFNHMCAVMCNQYKALYIFQTMVSGENDRYYYLNITDDQFHSMEINKHYDNYISSSCLIDIDRCQSFIESQREQLTVFLGEIIKIRMSYWKLRFLRIRSFLHKIKYSKQFHPQKNNIDYWLLLQSQNKERLKNIKEYKKHIKFEQLPCGEQYYYYAFHLEPEATVLYLAEGLYKNQVKLIENIAVQLPVGTYLYVKDHPHELGYRSVEDYKKIQDIPNVRLLEQSMPGKKVIKNAIGVFTINGTAGFEALLLNKQVYTFGPAYYDICKRVNYIKNIRDLREILYKNRDIKYDDDSELYPFINAYLNSLKEGIVDFFSNRAEKYGIDMNKNFDQLAADFVKFAQQY
jgi:capsule polysaccharide modification protein KpsS